MVAEVVELLSGSRVLVDLTIGAGGHAAALLDAGVERVVGVDRDPDALEEARTTLAGYGERVRLVEGTFAELDVAAAEADLQEADGVLYDLGVSSMQLDRSDRGFSYREDGPLDMRMGAEPRTAADVVNRYRERELERVLHEGGEERFARRIARAIVRARARRPIQTTRQLAAVIAVAVPRRRGGPHPARLAFQAIRIEVNREIEELDTSLPRAVQLLAPGGRIVVIAYHSLEDRIVKRFLRESELLEVITRKPLRPSEAEVERNPRARSARLRAAERRTA